MADPVSLSALALAAAAGYLISNLSDKNGTELDISNNISSNLSVESFFSSKNSCVNIATSDQNIDIKIDDTSKGAIGNLCKACGDAKTHMVNQRTNLEQDAARLNRNYRMQTAHIFSGSQDTSDNDPVPTDPMPTANPSVEFLSNPCIFACHSVLANIYQTQSYTSKVNCTISDSDTTNIAQSIDASVKDFLQNTQDAPSQLLSAFSKNQQSQTSNISTTLASAIVEDFESVLNSTVQAAQNIKVTGNSIYMDSVSQSYTSQNIMSLDSVNKATNDITQSASYTVSQSLINTQDTLGELTDSIVNTMTIIAELIPNITVDVITILACGLVIVLWVMFLLYNYNNTVKKSVDEIADNLTHRVR